MVFKTVILEKWEINKIFLLIVTAYDMREFPGSSARWGKLKEA